MLIDYATVHVKAGRGGNGCESYECRGPRKYYPTGGHGGQGGSIIFRADNNIQDLSFFKFNKHLKADSGQQGGSNKKTGRSAKDVIFTVPLGTTIYSSDGYLIRDLTTVGDEVIVAQGGRAGRGNCEQKEATPGKPGEEFDIVLDYRIQSDIIFLGPGNSGKTTLLSYLTRARVEPASYSFSTKSPQLGMYETEEYEQYIICDLPSVARNAHSGRGVGNTFLKHLRRAKLIFIIVEPESDFAENLEDAVRLVITEMEIYSKELSHCPFFVVVNKIDVNGITDELKKEKERLKQAYKNVYTISSHTGEGIKELMRDAIAIVKGTNYA